MSRHAGLIVPLFSIASSGGWGIGEMPDIAPLARWMASAGFDRLMLLPVGTMPAGETSPYAASSTFSIDPIFIGLDRVPDFARAGGERALSTDGRAALADVRGASRVEHAGVRRVKDEALRLAFRRFLEDEWELRTPRAGAFAAFVARERWWLDDYALFHALVEALPPGSWRTWPEPIRDRESSALALARRHLARDVLRHQYWQWIAHGQWQDARAAARADDVAIVGDLPFVAGVESADVWSRQREFRLDVSAGAPPDAFSATGQDWGLPFYDWPVIAGTGFATVRERMRRMAALFDVVRVDHLVGLYRTYGRPPLGDPFFSPPWEHEQLAQGEAVLGLMQASGIGLIAEDLGTVPDFVRQSLARLGIPGCRVLRWERDWHAPGQPFLDPAGFPPVSAAMTGTHDTEPLAEWWRTASEGDRLAVLALPAMQRAMAGDAVADAAGAEASAPWSPRLRDALLALAFGARSNELFLPMQDVFGWPDRINTPATVSAANWTWRLPWPVDRWAAIAEPRQRAAFTVALSQATDRAGA